MTSVPRVDGSIILQPINKDAQLNRYFSKQLAT